MIARSLLLIAGILPPLIALVRIVAWSVNVPYTDEWDWTGLAVAAHANAVSWDMLWEPHNGHRQIVSNVLFLAIERLGGWNVVREQLLGLAFVIVGLIGLERLTRRTLPPLAAAAAFALFSWLIAGPIAYENFLIGWQMSWQLGLASVLVAVERLSDVPISRGKLAVAVAAAVLASFSVVSGLIIWPCGLLVLLGVRASLRAVAAWTAAWVITLAAYFAGYSYSAVTALRAHSTADAAAYALIYLGAPLRAGPTSLVMVAATGAVLLAAFTVAVIAARSARTAAPRFWPWCALGGYAVCGAALTAFTRAGIGAYQAQSPRYASISLFLIVGSVGLLLPPALALVGRSTAWRAAGALVAAVFIVSAARSVKLGSIVWRDYDFRRSVALAGIAQNDPATFWDSYPDPVRLEQYLDALRTIDDGPLIER